MTETGILTGGIPPPSYVRMSCPISLSDRHLSTLWISLVASPDCCGGDRNWYPVMKMPSRLATTLCGISLKTPILAASGTYAYGVEFKKLADLSAVGGNRCKRPLARTHGWQSCAAAVRDRGRMMNSIGLQNIGVRAFVEQKLPGLRDCGTAIFRQRVRIRGGRLSGGSAGPRGRRRHRRI